MEPSIGLLARLSGLLAENDVGVALLTPRPRGGRLSGEPRREVEDVLDALGPWEPARTSVVYGNGCFAVGRYNEAATVYRRILERGPAHQEARFNLGLAYLRLKRLGEAA